MQSTIGLNFVFVGVSYQLTLLNQAPPAALVFYLPKVTPDQLF